ncbi:MAG: DUF1266 domain-containing protein [Defluviitaleaceae bacterium]|nr:DUF1266 domain-containing protein [Defluviitaleaceae bacterium]
MIDAIIFGFFKNLFGTIRGRILFRAILISGILTGVILFIIEENVSDDVFTGVLIGSFLFFALLIRYAERTRILKKLAVSEEKRRYLLFGGLLIARNNERNTIFKLFKTPRRSARTLLSNDWSIGNAIQARGTAQRLVDAEVHTPFADDVYHNLIKNGIFSPSPEDLANLEESAARQIPRINKGLAAYKKVLPALAKAGITDEEIAGITTLAAWDYGRVAFIVRYSTHAGQMTEEESWPYLQAAAEAATLLYTGWKQYVAAYVIGRAIAYGEVFHLGAKRFDEKSDYATVPFKG